MKAMKLQNHRIVWIAAALLGIMSCARLEMAPEGNAPEGETLSFTAVWADSGQTKTAIHEGGPEVWWSPSESIDVFSGSNQGVFTSTNAEPAPSVTFTGTIPVSTGTSVFWAVYPHTYDSAFDGSYVTMTVPRVQTATAGTFADNVFPAVARAAGTDLSFYNVCGGAVFSVTQEGVQFVTFTSRGGENLVGKVKVGLDAGGIPYVESVMDGSNTVVVSAPKNQTFEVGKKYYAVFLPGTLSSGLSVSFQTAYQKASTDINREIVVHRSLFGRLLNVDEGVEYVIDNELIEADQLSLYDTFAQQVASHGGASLYSPTRALFNLCGDDVYAAGASFGDHEMLAALNEFRYGRDNEVVTRAFLNYYTAINEFNRLISLYQDADSAAARRLVAEGRVLRAYLYFLLAAGWGTPPFVDTFNPDFNNPDPVFHVGATAQQSQAWFFNWCASECEAVLDNLDERESTADVQGAYKVTKGFANALAGKAYLFAKNYEEAKTALQRVIDSRKYALVSGENYWQNFHVEGDGNAEKVFESNLEYDDKVTLWGGAIQRSTWMESQNWNWRSDHFVPGAAPHGKYTGGVAGWGGLGVPQWFGDEFFDNDYFSYRYNATLKRIDDAVYDMEYNNEEINAMTRDEKKASHAVGIASVSGLYGQSFYLPFKQLVRATDVGSKYGSNIRLNNFTIMRYAEVLLLYAEACLGTGDADYAKRAVNQIQERAGSRTVSASVDLNVIKREKSYELWLEGCRWLDLLRWEDYDGVYNAGQDVPVLYDKIFRAPQPGESVTWLGGSEDNRFYTVPTHGAVDAGFAVGFRDVQHKFFPIPSVVMQANSLNQTTGW